MADSSDKKSMYVLGAKDLKPRQVEHITDTKTRQASYVGESRRGGALYQMLLHTEHGLRIQVINERRIQRSKNPGARQ